MMNNGDSFNSQLPPPNNPILEAYLAFRNGTPFVTRLLLSSQVICFFLSFFIDTQQIAANIPYLVVYGGQIWRILLSPLLCNRFLSLLIAFFSFTEPGRRLERSVGSTSFLCLVTTLATMTNLAYIIFMFILCELTGKEEFLHQQTSGIWIVIFGIITIECNRAPPESTRRLFCFPVRVEFFPLALFGFFCFFTGTFEWSHLISIGIGYAYDRGHLESIKPTSQRCKRWEETSLNGLANGEGWVKLDQIIGSGAWSADAANESSGSGLFSQVRNQLQGVSTNGFSAGNETSQVTTSSFPTTGGHVLGGASKRANTQSAADARRARLLAIERRLNEASEEGGDHVV